MRRLSQIPLNEGNDLTEPSRGPSSIGHGEQCTCKLLAQALGLDPQAMTYEYCHRVLHKHWSMNCHHGRPAKQPAATAAGERWGDVDPVDPVKAILIINDQRGE